MLYQYIVYCLGIFCIVLEVIVLFYMLQGIIDFGKSVRKFSLMLIAPMLFPMQKLIRKSIMNTFSIDLSPYILLVIISYMGHLCNYLLTM